MTVAPDGTVEFSRRLRLDRLAAGDVRETHEATEAECKALADRFGLIAVQSLTGGMTVRRPADGPLIRVEGWLSARVTQKCVVSLESFDADLEDTFVQLFTLESGEEPEDGEVFVSLEDEDAPEPVTGGAIDLGEVLAEQLALALDPHPRKPGVAFSGASFGEGDDPEDDVERNPFAALKDLKTGQ